MEKAIQDYNQAIKLNPKNAGAFNDRGNTYTKLKQFEKAIQDYNQAIELDPEYTHAGTAYAFNNRGTETQQSATDFDANGNIPIYAKVSI
jgi:tetratricopeptide (TPR) repeat protein